jgi:aldehyde dehydrogenase (NAD+)
VSELLTTFSSPRPHSCPNLPPSHTGQVKAPSTDKVIANVAEGSANDVDRAVYVSLFPPLCQPLRLATSLSSCILTLSLLTSYSEAAQKAYETVWGERCAPRDRGKLLNKLADLFDEHSETLASIEALDNGKAYGIAKAFDVAEAANCLRYYAGWADKDHGKGEPHFSFSPCLASFLSF